MNAGGRGLGRENLRKLKALGNAHVVSIVKKYIDLCKPDKVTILTDSGKDIDYVRNISIKNSEEKKLAIKGHTVHFDGYYDQGRDKSNTKILLTPGLKLSKKINTVDMEEGLKEITRLLGGIMKGKEMFIAFYCLGPTNSKFSISAMQITDSAYVIHDAFVLYRPGYEEFKSLGSKNFFHFIHSAGELENGVSKNIDKRRVYIDLRENRVFTVNTQYAGNSLGLKKLAFRLAIKKAQEESWLAEHMFIIGVHPPNKDRTTYFTGAFPSACGKTSTAMLSGNTIVGDDLAYLRVWEDGTLRAVNIERGSFGMPENTNPDDDPLLYKSLTTPKELIFSNVLVADGKPCWPGMGKELPKSGRNHAGQWKQGDKDKEGNIIPAASKNARFAMNLEELENVDTHLHDPNGVVVSGIIYGGRDSDTSPPLLESFDWLDGVLIGASIESETTAATLGATGIRDKNPMANMDFLSVPLGKYIQSHLQMEDRLKKMPRIFSTNYFLKEDGKYLNGKLDKKVWLVWMEGRVNGDYGATETPIGLLPKFEDLKKLFRHLLGKDYTEAEYVKQFSIRIGKLLERLDRIEGFYKEEDGVPQELFDRIKMQREKLLAAKKKHDKDNIPPSDFM